jgi:hypothetical protein
MVEPAIAARQAKVLDVTIDDPDGAPVHDLALVDVALVDGTHTGAGAVVTAARIRAVVAAIAKPDSTGLSSIAGRLHPLDRDEPGAIAVHLDPQSRRRVRAPVMPGHFDTLGVVCVAHLVDGQPVRLDGPGVLALDGEREHVLGSRASATVTVRRDGPFVVSVPGVLDWAAREALFDDDPEAHDGD